MEVEKGTTGTPATATPVAKSSCKCMMIDVALRFLLLAACIVAVVVMATSKQTKMMPVPNVPGLTVAVPAKFSHSPAFIYFMAALSVAGLYSIITIIASLSYMSKPIPAKMFLILAAHDVLILGIVAAATGAAGGVAYIGLKGNTHVQWDKICNKYDKFCVYIATSISNSLFASVVLVFLIILNIYSLYKRIP